MSPAVPDGIRLLTFDVVGTMIDFETGILDCVHAIAGTSVPDDEVLECFGRAEGEQQRLNPQLPFTRMLEPIYHRMSAELGLPAGRHTALRESIPRWPAFPDAPEALRALGRRFRLVALTNTDRWALERMSETLGSPFHDGVTTEDVGVNKPDPRMFAYCLGRQSVHGYRQADCLHVAQSQFHDIGAARALGFRTCRVRRRGEHGGFGATPSPAVVTEPDHLVGSLAELAELTGLA